MKMAQLRFIWAVSLFYIVIFNLIGNSIHSSLPINNKRT